MHGKARIRNFKIRLSRSLLVLTAGVLSVCVFFRYQIANGFTQLIGDRYDQVIAVSIFEHWRNVLLGVARWSETGYFFPVRDTLGYDDGYLLYGIIYSAFRGLGADPFLGGELVNVTIRLVGFFSFFIAARLIFRLPYLWAILGSVLFTISNNVFVESGHTQVLGVSLAPLMAILLERLFVSIDARKSVSIIAWGFAGAALYGAWLLSTFYMAWYFLFFIVFVLAVYFFLGRREAISQLASNLCARLPAALSVFLFFIASCVPFAFVYLPKARETGMHSFSEVLGFTISPLDIVHVGEGNLLYGRIIAFLNNTFRPGFPSWSEQMTGIPFCLLFCFICGAVWLCQKPPADRMERSQLLRATAIAVILTWVLALRVGNFTLWWFVYELFPGAGAARVVARYQIFLQAPVLVVSLCYLHRNSQRIATPILLLVCVWLVAEELNLYPSLNLNRTTEVARLASIPKPPSQCGAFFTTLSRPDNLHRAVDSIYSHNVEAMIIAETMHVPTLNGYATFVPPHWHLVSPENPDYLRRVKMFVQRYPVADLCELNLQTRTWISNPLS